MTRRKPAVVLQWLRAVVDECAEDASPSSPEEPATIAVATVRALHADPDGGSCYPAQTTVAGMAHVSPRTVKAVDDWLLAHKLMALTRRRARGLREYRLTVPDTATQTHLRADPDTSTHDDLNAGRSTPDRLQIDQVDLQPPTSDRREEEEERLAASADAPAAGATPAGRRAAQQIADRARVLLNADDVGAAVDRVVERSGWSHHTVAAIGSNIAARSRTNATAYVTAGLDALDVDSIELPAPLRALNLLADLRTAEDQHYDLDPYESERWSAIAGWEHLEEEFVPDINLGIEQSVELLTAGQLHDLEYRINRQLERIQQRLEGAA